MQIEYVVTRHKREVPDHIGGTLIARKIARRVVDEVRTAFADSRGEVRELLPRRIKTRDIKAEETEISPRTGKPKRKRTYKRRDMQAE